MSRMAAAARVRVATRLAALLLAGAGCAGAGSPLGSQDAARFDPGDLVTAVGADGTILRSTDGGLTWEEPTSGSSALLRGVWFADAEHGWAAGDQDLLRTTDGGETWTSLSPTTTTLRNVFFSDLSNGWAVGSDGEILSSTDGGASWTPQDSGTDFTLEGVWFVDALHGWVCGGHGEEPYEGIVLATSNGGLDWDEQLLVPENAFLGDVQLVDAASGWTVGANGTIRHTTDGGLTWTSQDQAAGSGPYEVDFVDADHGWAVGLDRVLRTTDGGTTWTVAPKPAGADVLRGIDFFDATTGLVVGGNGEIHRTTDGGVTWDLQDSGTDVTLVDVVFHPGGGDPEDQDADGDGVLDGDDDCPGEAALEGADLDGDGCTDTLDQVLEAADDLCQALTAAADDPATPDEAADALREAAAWTCGNNGGDARNGMADKIEQGNLVAAATKALKVLDALAEAAGVDTRAWEERAVDLLLAALALAIDDAAGPARAFLEDALDARAAGDLYGAVDAAKASAQALP